MSYNLDWYEFTSMIENCEKTEFYNKEIYESSLQFFCFDSIEADSAMRVISQKKYDSLETKQKLIDKICQYPSDALCFLSAYDKNYSQEQKMQIIESCLQDNYSATKLLVRNYEDLNQHHKNIIMEYLKKSRDQMYNFFEYRTFFSVEYSMVEELINFLVAQKDTTYRGLTAFIKESFYIDGNNSTKYTFKDLEELRMKVILRIMQMPFSLKDFFVEKVSDRLLDKEKQVIYNLFVKEKLISLKGTFNPFSDLIKLYQEVVDYEMFKVFVGKLIKDRYKHHITRCMYDLTNLPQDLKDVLESRLVAERLGGK